MKTTIATSGALVFAACLLSGCGQSNDSAKNTTPASPTPQATTPPTPPTAPASAPADAQSAASTAAPAQSQPATADSTPPTSDQVASAKNAATEPVAQFAATAAKQTDQVAASIGSELAAKAKSLTQSVTANPDVMTKVATAMQSLSTGKEAGALGVLFQEAKQASLTPQQTQLFKDMGNLASAYVVQRNFSSLDGAQNEVATIVNSLRKGTIASAVPALQSLTQNASLTSQQKDLLGTLADQYAPGLSKASASLKQGLQGLQGLPK